MSAVVTAVSTGLALGLLTLLLAKVVRALYVLAVALVPLGLRVAGGLAVLAALPSGIAGRTSALPHLAAGLGCWLLGHWLFARTRGYFAGAAARRLLRLPRVRALDPTGGHEVRPVYEYVPRPLVLVVGR